MFGIINIPECVTCKGNCSSAERAFLSDFRSLKHLSACQKVTYFVFAIFLVIYFEDVFVGLRCSEQTCLMFIDQSTLE